MEDDYAVFWETYAPRICALFRTQTRPSSREARLWKPPHVCRSGCALLEERAYHPVLYVCRASGHVHICTPRLCRHARDQTGPHSDNTVQMRVCTLTGVAFPPELHRGFGNQPVYHCQGGGGSYDSDPDVGDQDDAVDEDDGGVDRDVHDTGVTVDIPEAPDEAAVASPTQQTPRGARKRKAPTAQEAAVSCPVFDAPPGTAPPAPARKRKATARRTRKPQSVASEKAALQRRRGAFLTRTRDMLTTATDGTPMSDAVDALVAHMERVWQLLRQSTAFAECAARLRPDMLALVVLYTLTRGLAMPVDGHGHVTLWPASTLVNQRLPSMKRNPNYAVRRVTATHKVFMRCLNTVPHPALAAFAAQTTTLP